MAVSMEVAAVQGRAGESGTRVGCTGVLRSRWYSFSCGGESGESGDGGGGRGDGRLGRGRDGLGFLSSRLRVLFVLARPSSWTVASVGRARRGAWRAHSRFCEAARRGRRRTWSLVRLVPFLLNPSNPEP